MYQYPGRERPTFCGFAVPVRQSFEPFIYRKRKNIEDYQYHRVEQIWDRCWTGESTLCRSMSTIFAFQGVGDLKMCGDNVSDQTPCFLTSVLFPCRRRSRSTDSIDSMCDYDEFDMPAFPDDYVDPVALY